VEVHNFEVKVPVEGEQQKLWPPGEAELNNRTRRWDSNVHGVFLEATPQHLLLRAGAEAPSVELAEALVLGKLVRAIELLEDAYELELGTPAFRCTCEPSEDTGDVPTEALDLALVGHLLVDELGVVDDLAAVEVVDRHLAEQVGVLEEGAGLDEVVDVAALAAAVEGANLGRDELVDRERLDLDSVALGELEGPGDGLGDREALDGRAFDLDPLVGLRGQGLVAADDAEHPAGVLVVGVDVRVLVVEDVDESAPHPGAFVLHGVAGAEHVEVQIDAEAGGVLEVELVEGGTALKTSRPERTSSSVILRGRSTSRSSRSASRSEHTPMDRPQREALFSVSSSIPPPQDVHVDLDAPVLVQLCATLRYLNRLEAQEFLSSSTVLRQL
jgi:hypothetical protein